MTEDPQESYLAGTSLRQIVLRGIKKTITEMSSVKTLFLTFLCVAGWYDKISDTWLIVGGLAVLGVKELPSDIFVKIIDKVGGK